MDKRIEKLKKEYHDIPIPDRLDFVVKKAIKQEKKKRTATKWVVGVAAATVLFIGGININPTFAKTVSEIPIISSLVKVLTFTEFKVDEESYNADIKVPAIENLKNESLQSALNKKYLEESKELYNQFTAEMEDLKLSNGGHVGIDSGYEVKTDTEQILSIGRYVVNTAGSSSTIYKFDTIDKQNGLLITLPSLFKSGAYVNVISKEIKRQMILQMEQDSSLIYWVNDPNNEEQNSFDPFEKIKADQNFYINKENKLVIVFDKYEVAPGYMGVVEFIIPSDVLSDILVSHQYIK